MYRQLEKNLLSSNISPTCPHNIPLAAEILSLVWCTPGNFNGFCVLAALLHGTLVVGVSQTEGVTCIRQGGHHVGHWPTFLVFKYFIVCPGPMFISDSNLVQHFHAALCSMSKVLHQTKVGKLLFNCSAQNM